MLHDARCRDCLAPPACNLCEAPGCGGDRYLGTPHLSRGQEDFFCARGIQGRLVYRFQNGERTPAVVREGCPVLYRALRGEAWMAFAESGRPRELDRGAALSTRQSSIGERGVRRQKTKGKRQKAKVKSTSGAQRITGFLQ